MSIKVLPSINCDFRDLECVERKVRLASAFAPMLHVDIADGAFTFHKSWNHPEAWPGLGIKTAFEVHLMVEDPFPYAEKWLAAGAKRLIVQLETVDPAGFDNLKNMAAARGAELMLASNPETRLDRYEPFMDKCDKFLVLAVHPGLSGQHFLPRALEKVSALRARVPNATIEVDGGVNFETGALAKSAGADALVADHFIFSHVDPSEAYSALLSL